MIEVPKKEYKYMISAEDSLKLQISFQTMIGPKFRSHKNLLDSDEISIVAILALQQRPVTIQELCVLAFPELYSDGDDATAIHIRHQQIRNKINKLCGKGLLKKVDDPANKRIKYVRVGDLLNLTVPDHSMIVFKLFTPSNASNQAQATNPANS